MNGRYDRAQRSHRTVRQVSGIARAPPCVAEQFFGMVPEKKGVGGPVTIAGVKVSHDRGSGEPADANVEIERDHCVELVLSARALAASTRASRRRSAILASLGDEVAPETDPISRQSGLQGIAHTLHSRSLMA